MLTNKPGTWRKWTHQTCGLNQHMAVCIMRFKNFRQSGMLGLVRRLGVLDRAQSGGPYGAGIGLGLQAYHFCKIACAFANTVHTYRAFFAVQC